MNKVWFWAFVVALGGFLFGFDTAVISGAEQYIQELWNLSAVSHGFTVSVALFGTVLGAFLGGRLSDLLGRKNLLLYIGLAYFISAVGSALATDWYAFVFFRFLGGVGVGCSSVTGPLYIAEISQKENRGKMVAMFQFNVVLGILIAFLSNYALAGLDTNSWRWMLGVEAVPAALFVALLFFIPNSPRWLILFRNKDEEASKILAASGEKHVLERIREIKDSVKDEGGNAQKVAFFTKAHWKPISLVVVFALFNQLSGINAIIYYAPRIFELAGLGKSSALLSTTGIGLINFSFTLLAMFFIDNFGRKKLMLVGSVGLILTLAGVAFSFTLGIGGMLVPALLFAYIAFFAFSQGAVIWVFFSEVFPNSIRGRGQALGSFTHWLMAAIIAWVFPILADFAGPAITFGVFAVMMTVQLVWVVRVMPETKGISLDTVQNELTLKAS